MCCEKGHRSVNSADSCTGAHASAEHRTCCAASRHFSFAISSGSPCSSGRSRLAALTLNGSGCPASKMATTCCMHRHLPCLAPILTMHCVPGIVLLLQRSRTACKPVFNGVVREHAKTCQGAITVRKHLFELVCIASGKHDLIRAPGVHVHVARGIHHGENALDVAHVAAVAQQGPPTSGLAGCSA